MIYAGLAASCAKCIPRAIHDVCWHFMEFFPFFTISEHFIRLCSLARSLTYSSIHSFIGSIHSFIPSECINKMWWMIFSYRYFHSCHVIHMAQHNRTELQNTTHQIRFEAEASSRCWCYIECHTHTHIGHIYRRARACVTKTSKEIEWHGAQAKPITFYTWCRKIILHIRHLKWYWIRGVNVPRLNFICLYQLWQHSRSSFVNSFHFFRCFVFGCVPFGSRSTASPAATCHKANRFIHFIFVFAIEHDSSFDSIGFVFAHNLK